jgi:DNA-directed RNA polymerase subunit RPC12/RpoP
MSTLHKVTELCRQHPTDGETHECMAGEMRCVYCGARLWPYQCNGCGRFLTAKQMHEAATTDGIWRCEECT